MRTEKSKSSFFVGAWFVVALMTLFTACNPNKMAGPDDWPQYKNDNFRSGHSSATLDLSTMDLDWVYKASQLPVPAWYGPAKEDAYAKSGPLPSMRDYDIAYYPVVVGDYLYYSSSADDAVHCIDALNGDEKWCFTTGGPVRIAPVWYEGRLYFGSDDGFVYCIDARRGHLKWKYSPASDKSMVLNNGRLISYWPVRTGVLIEGGKAYFGASLLPWKNSYFCAIDINSGKPEGEGCYVKELGGMTFEGAMASTGNRLIQPQGRIAPVFFDKKSGEKAGSLPGSGGCYVLVTPDKHIVHPQTSRRKAIAEFVDKEQPEFMSFKGGKALVVKGDTSFVLTDNNISAYHRKSKELLWLRRGYNAHRIVMTNNVLLAGATDKVYAINPDNGLPLWEGDVEGTVYALAVAGSKIYASTGEGKIYCFGVGGAENPLLAKNMNQPPVIEERQEEPAPDEGGEKLVFKTGPVVKALSPTKVKLFFETEQPCSISMEWAAGEYSKDMFEAGESRKFAFELPVRKDFKYTASLRNDRGETASVEYDNFLNFSRCQPDFSTMGDVSEKLQSEVGDLLEISGLKKGSHKGLCFVFGMGKELLPAELARQSGMDVIVMDESAREVNGFRDRIQEFGFYGRNISAVHVSDLNHPSISSEMANLVYLPDGDWMNADPLIKTIAPRGVAFIKGVTLKWLEQSTLKWQVDVVSAGDEGLLLRKHLPETIGEWTHQYGHPDNSAFGGESFWGSTRSEDFEIRWMGRPGPRFQTDRSGRKPSPLAVEGKMFVQGNQRVVAMDIYNGTILWFRDFKGLRRMNMPRDCSNWAADKGHLFMAIGKNLLKVNQEDGEVAAVFSIEKEGYDWGYISVLNDKIIGSAVPQGSHYTDYYGGSGWYDAQRGVLTDKIVSKLLFATDKSGKNRLWEYVPRGLVVNATITIYKNQICFVESLDAKISEAGRGGEDLFANARMVNLDVNTGKKNWEKRVKTQPGITMYSMAAGSDKYVLVSSNNQDYEVVAFDSHDGKRVWGKVQKWFHGNHGGHMSRPAIANNRLVVKPGIYDLNTGEREDFNMPKSGHGCASYALTEQAVFYRGGDVTQFNFDTREFSRWDRLRPDCWISTIPAQGMVLSPEAGGGCSCGNWLETSMVMAPISRAPVMIRPLVDNPPDYKSETWGDYARAYTPQKFDESIKVELKAKPGVEGIIRYTTDGSVPSTNSAKYQGPITLQKSCLLKASLFTQKEGKTRQYTRGREFVKR